MTDGHARGASSGLDAAHRALRELVMAATVRIHRPGVGYALDETGTFLGSGFFVAPNWVLTCAHVALGGEGDEVAVVYENGPGRGGSVVPGAVAATVPERPAGAVRGNWPAPDLALVRLREPVDHDCVYVSERPAAYYDEGRVFYAGWTVLGGQLQVMDGPLSVQGTLGGWSSGVQMRLGHNDLPPGVSGGPVIDPLRGEVIGVLKSRSDHGSGGTSTGIEQLRALTVPRDGIRSEHCDLYQAVFHAHDRYHRDRQRHPDSERPTWADVQGQLGARPGRALSPDERIQLLGRLADLPPPASTRGLLDILESLPGLAAAIPQPAPRGWRDGLGALYESAREDGALELVIDYAMRVMSADRPFETPGTQDAEQALWEWLRQSAEGLGTRYRHILAQRRIDLLRPRHSPGSAPLPPQRGRRDPLDLVPATPYGTPPSTGSTAFAPSNDLAPGLEASLAHDPARGEQAEAHTADRTPRPCALLELVQRGWEPDRCDWRISVARPDGEVVRLEEAERLPLDALPGPLVGPLAEAFRHCDRPGRPALLQVALPRTLLGLPVDTWQLGPDGTPLGAERPVVVRSVDRDQLPDGAEFVPYEKDPLADDEEQREREARWHWVHSHDARPEVLDCDDGLRIPVPPLNRLRGLPHGAIPILCRYGDQRFEDDTVALARIVHGGFGVALWRRWRGRRDAVCGEFHRRAGDTVAGAGGAERLPELVHTLRAGLRAGRTETYWADGIALFYDDPHRPLPGSDDLLEAP
ncbi:MULTISPECIES: trypsin-like peptidase domain-containing protein [unclassified Streptomyces]|uniref:VMAP-C domain-containing protein n=1 Tax=unclassified Streptomyces TaxID=2593676 RepID=UPI003D913C2E